MSALMNPTVTLRDAIVQIRCEVLQFQSQVEVAATEFEVRQPGLVCRANTISSRLQAIRQRLLAH